MEKDRNQKYVESLVRSIESKYQFLKSTVEDFQEKCLMITPERGAPQAIIIGIREAYKEIRDTIKEIKSIQQLLIGKYRQYYRRDPIRDKEILELSFIAKNCYSKFEYTLLQKQAQERAREKERALRMQHQDLPFKWFQSKDNQLRFVRNLRLLMGADGEVSTSSENEERGNPPQDRPTSMTLFAFIGDTKLLDELYSQMQSWENAILERYNTHELRGVFTYFSTISPSEVEEITQRFLESRGFLKLKCLLWPIHSQKEMKVDITDWIRHNLEQMGEGEVKTLLI
jgi:hypothetical protein